ncbi:hypothetical protein [Candidatus Tisiphia endosymbiont of Thecophora atra]|uniref:hypothetical protein n=1 Tax=Candidatus Tisiphia endosymbiont of Thecophora atra TaxID=3066258 RepID=UPI00312C9EC4
MLKTPKESGLQWFWHEVCSHVNDIFYLTMLEFRDIISFMYITTVPNRNSRPAILLRTSYREDGKVLNKTIANLTNWDELRIEAFKKMLKGEFDGLDGVPPTSAFFNKA